MEQIAWGAFELDVKAAAGIAEAPPPDPKYLPPAAVVPDGLSVDLSFTSPAGASVTQAFEPIPPCPDLSAYRSLQVVAIIRGGTGGTLDIYIQAEYVSGGWVDIAHFAQLADGAAQITRTFAVTREAQQTTITTVGANQVPALAANTVIGGSFGRRLRVVAVTGSNNTAGAQQLIGCFLAR